MIIFQKMVQEISKALERHFVLFHLIILMNRLIFKDSQKKQSCPVLSGQLESIKRKRELIPCKKDRFPFLY